MMPPPFHALHNITDLWHRFFEENNEHETGAEAARRRCMLTKASYHDAARWEKLLMDRYSPQRPHAACDARAIYAYECQREQSHRKVQRLFWTMDTRALPSYPVGVQLRKYEVEEFGDLNPSLDLARAVCHRFEWTTKMTLEVVYAGLVIQLNAVMRSRCAPDGAHQWSGYIIVYLLLPETATARTTLNPADPEAMFTCFTVDNNTRLPNGRSKPYFTRADMRRTMRHAIQTAALKLLSVMPMDVMEQAYDVGAFHENVKPIFRAYAQGPPQSNSHARVVYRYV
jgi:hypothetical protein